MSSTEIEKDPPESKTENSTTVKSIEGGTAKGVIGVAASAGAVGSVISAASGAALVGSAIAITAIPVAAVIGTSVGAILAVHKLINIWKSGKESK